MFISESQYKRSKVELGLFWQGTYPIILRSSVRKLRKLADGLRFERCIRSRFDKSMFMNATLGSTVVTIFAWAWRRGLVDRALGSWSRGRGFKSRSRGCGFFSQCILAREFVFTTVYGRVVEKNPSSAFCEGYKHVEWKKNLCMVILFYSKFLKLLLL